ncbi:hypothetical protein [Methylobacterium gnaphalii]|uniref:Uncharacterized protein n=1 Tax=Methylobacterium gnaphalii TaxID=1010610 RepID=A0A512JJM3_9HYPH|nr:hypothetical protein [Methylobacterium gnaphalii]GEP10133.1 hypothetical protein MGN01_19780 [Methylobacterium gnaphalii]GJD69489.1 hypothetical protein MMMDOFMJ_2420 [Methylobacterium gnaphalii]GLS48403.1 hypothetical protein GCM10007885_12470 [Methylobacterium gnaphalii]
MTGSVENAKDIAKVEAKTADATKFSPADLLKKAVSGKPEAGSAAATGSPATSAKRWAWPAVDGRLAAVATVALVVGTTFGLIAAPRERSGDALGRIEAALDTNRSEATRLKAEIAHLSTALGSLRETTSAARTDIKTIAPSLGDRVARLEQGLDKKFAALSERVARAEREQAAPVAAVEKRPAAPVAAQPTTSPASAASTPRSEPTQTGSIADTKPKQETVEAWALRDVYDGVAMLEDRKRRLLEVARGDTVPGVGRVEAIERRGRVWVVVTKQGVITPQTW